MIDFRVEANRRTAGYPPYSSFRDIKEIVIALEVDSDGGPGV